MPTLSWTGSELLFSVSRVPLSFQSCLKHLHLTYWGLWRPHTAKSKKEMALASTEPLGLPLSVTRLTKKNKLSFLFIHCWQLSKPHQQGCWATAHSGLQWKQSSFKQLLSLHSRQQEIQRTAQDKLWPQTRQPSKVLVRKQFLDIQCRAS